MLYWNYALPPYRTTQRSEADILAEFGAQFLESSFLVFTDHLQLNVFILETMKLLDTHNGSDPAWCHVHNMPLSLSILTFFSPLICSASVLSWATLSLCLSRSLCSVWLHSLSIFRSVSSCWLQEHITCLTCVCTALSVCLWWGFLTAAFLCVRSAAAGCRPCWQSPTWSAWFPPRLRCGASLPPVICTIITRDKLRTMERKNWGSTGKEWLGGGGNEGWLRG